jgi:hypothetical protein
MGDYSLKCKLCNAHLYFGEKDKCICKDCEITVLKDDNKDLKAKAEQLKREIDLMETWIEGKGEGNLQEWKKVRVELNLNSEEK